MLVERKLQGAYGFEQLPRYLAGLQADKAHQKALSAPAEWLRGADTLQLLLELGVQTTRELADSGLFAALAKLTPTTPSPAPDAGLLDEPAP